MIFLRQILCSENEGGSNQPLRETHRHYPVHGSTGLCHDCRSSSSHSMWNGSEIWFRKVKLLKIVDNFRSPQQGQALYCVPKLEKGPSHMVFKHCASLPASEVNGLWCRGLISTSLTVQFTMYDIFETDSVLGE